MSARSSSLASLMNQHSPTNDEDSAVSMTSVPNYLFTFIYSVQLTLIIITFKKHTVAAQRIFIIRDMTTRQPLGGTVPFSNGLFFYLRRICEIENFPLLPATNDKFQIPYQSGVKLTDTTMILSLENQLLKTAFDMKNDG